MRLFRYFESLLEPTALPTQGPPPAGLGAFYWHYARQARGLVVALFVAGFIVALIDTTIPVFVGRVITLVSSHEPGSLLRDSWPAQSLSTLLAASDYSQPLTSEEREWVDGPPVGGELI